MAFRGWTASQLDNMCLSTPVHFSQSSTGIGADIVANDILYAILNVGLNNIGYGRTADGIAVGKLLMGKYCPPVLRPAQVGSGIASIRFYRFSYYLLFFEVPLVHRC